MKAVITGENDERVGVNLLDNNDTEHVIEMEFDGEIKYHKQDGYPDDPEERSLIDEVEPINQATRYAKYYVDRERDYDTVDWRQDPDRILAAALTVAELSPAAVEAQFGDLYDQVRSHFSDTERPVSLPADCPPGSASYEQDIYLGVDDERVAALGRAYEDSETVPASAPDASVEATLAAIVDSLPAESTPDRSALSIAAVSGIHVCWDDATGQYHHERHDHPDLDRAPDARVDLLPFAPDSIDEFRTQLVRNLWCQVRDCYIEMGVTPPEPFRLQGMGKLGPATWYEHYDFYQRYHDPDAEIDWEIEPADHRTD